MIKSDEHAELIIDQFSKQAPHFAKLPGHAESTQLLIQMAGIGPASNVLDLACGPGLIACTAAEAAHHVTGVDLTAAMIEQAKALQTQLGLLNVTWQVGDVRELSFAANSFDVVLTRYSFHHFLNPDAVLAEMVRVCKPGGRITVADLVLPAEKITAYDEMEKLRDPSHVHVLTESDLTELFESAGLKDICRGGYFFELELEELLASSFSEPRHLSRVRSMFEADVDADRLGINVHRSGEEMSFAYPIVILTGVKS